MSVVAGFSDTGCSVGCRSVSVGEDRAPLYYHPMKIGRDYQSRVNMSLLLSCSFTIQLNNDHCANDCKKRNTTLTFY